MSFYERHPGFEGIMASEHELVSGTGQGRIQHYSDDRQQLRFSVPGMISGLLPHQVIGARFMKRRLTDHRIPGGILADDMRLAKTVQPPAVVMSHAVPTRPRDIVKEDPYTRTASPRVA